MFSISAADAKQITQEYRATKSIEEAIDLVEREIIEAASEGETSCLVLFDPFWQYFEVIEQMLVSKGFEVEASRCQTFTVSW